MLPLEDLGLEIGFEPAETFTLSLHETIDLGNEAPGLCKFWGKAKFLLVNGYGEVEKDDYYLFNVFAVSEGEAKQKITDYFKELNSEAGRQGMDLELELGDVFVKNVSNLSPSN